jgi:hypothetical protein
MKLPRKLGLLLALALLSSSRLDPASLSGETPSAQEEVLPFGIGEEITYKVEWNPPWYLFFLPSMEAGTARLKISAGAFYQDKEALKIEFTATSSGTLAKLAGVKVDDSFEFLTDPATFHTFAVFKQVREGKRRKDISVVYFPRSSRLHILDVNLAETPARIDKDIFIEDVPAGVQDVFSALYSFRLEKLELGGLHQFIVGDNDRFGEVVTRIEKREFVKVPLGTYESWRVNTESLLGGLFQGKGKFRIWFSADERKMPMKFEAKVKLGKVTGKLKAYVPGTEPRAAIDGLWR